MRWKKSWSGDRWKKSPTPPSTIDQEWLDDSVNLFLNDASAQKDPLKGLIRVFREQFDSLRRELGGRKVTDDSRLSLLTAGLLVNLLAESDWTQTMPELKPGLQLAAGLVANLGTTGR